MCIFANLRINYTGLQSVEKSLKNVEFIEMSPRHPIDTFNDFSGTQIKSKNSEKIHGHLWCQNTLL